MRCEQNKRIPPRGEKQRGGCAESKRDEVELMTKISRCGELKKKKKKI